MIRTALSFLLLALMALPGAYKLSHALNGHIEIQCNEDIPNHFHQGEFDCDFHDFYFQTALQAPVLEFTTLRETRTWMPGESGPDPRYAEAYRYFSLRAPPV